MNAGPTLARTRGELAMLLRDAREAGRPLGLVPTMGALHEGHASLMRVARDRVGDGPVVVSVFVNPTQFAPTEDLDRYPRSLDADLEVCRREGVQVVFAPSVAEVYPGSGMVLAQPQVTVDPGELAGVLEGRTRPGHFQGVLTIVLKLFGLVSPDVAVFGEKDYQQLVLIRQMAADLCLDMDVVGAPTHREPDGLALSSRNRFLDPAQREIASSLSRALRAAQQAHTPAAAEAAARAVLAEQPGLELDYLVVTDSGLAQLPPQPEPGTVGRALIAARVGDTRLIDNVRLVLGRH